MLNTIHRLESVVPFPQTPPWDQTVSEVRETTNKEIKKNKNKNVYVDWLPEIGRSVGVYSQYVCVDSRASNIGLCSILISIMQVA